MYVETIQRKTDWNHLYDQSASDNVAVVVPSISLSFSIPAIRVCRTISAMEASASYQASVAAAAGARRRHGCPGTGLRRSRRSAPIRYRIKARKRSALCFALVNISPRLIRFDLGNRMKFYPTRSVGLVWVLRNRTDAHSLR